MTNSRVSLRTVLTVPEDPLPCSMRALSMRDALGSVPKVCCVHCWGLAGHFKVAL